MDTRPCTKPAPRLPGPATAAFLLCLPAAAAAKPAAKPATEPLADNVRDWWVLDNGKTLVTHKKDSFHSCPAAKGYLKLLHKAPGASTCTKLDEQTIGHEVGGKGYALLDVAAGKATTAVSGAGSYKAWAVEPGRDGFILMRTESQPPNSAFYRVETKTGKATRVYDTKDRHRVESVRLSDDGQKLVVWTESGDVGTMVQRTIDLQTRKATVKKVAGRLGEFPPRPIRTYVVKQPPRKIVEKDGRVWMQIRQRSLQMFKGEAREWCIPDRPASPTCLVIPRVVDTNKDGKIARTGGDWIEIWVVDLVNGRQFRIADTSQENTTRGWTPDGKYFLYNRIARGPGESKWQGDLIVFRRAGKQPMRFQPGPNTDYVSYHGQAEPDRLLISFNLFARDRRRVKITHFALLDLAPEPAIRLIGHGFPAGPDCEVAGRVLLYAVRDTKTKASRLFRCPLPPPLRKWERIRL